MLFAAGLICLLPGWLLAEPPKPPAYEPMSNYQKQTVQGWTILVNQRLLKEEQEIGRQASELLQVKLYEINRIVPAKPLARLHEVPIWLEYEDRGFPCACYHPSREWLTKNGYNPEKAKAVEIANARTFLKWTLHQPSMVLHELVHAYHDCVLGGYNQPEVLAAYRRAVEAKSYESVLYFTGEKKRAYALKAPEEYLAELTEAWFGTNDFYPFVHVEVLQHDPQAAKMLKNIWGE
jgi:hypothetical protein